MAKRGAERAPYGSKKAAREAVAALGLTPSYGANGVVQMPGVNPPMMETTETDDEIKSRIVKTFSVLNKMAHGVVTGTIPSLIVSGAPGCGKSHSIETMIAKAKRDGILNQSGTIKGSMSAIALYQEAYNYRGANDVLVIDDCDTIFGDLEAMNVLKAALDTKRVKTIHWNKESNILDAADVPRHFVFKGSIVFLSNLNFPMLIEGETKMAQHYRAFVDRSILIDLGIHTRREVLHRIRQVVYEPNFLAENEITHDTAFKAFQWIKANVEKLRSLSIRSVIQLAMMMKTDPLEWEDSATVTMFRRLRKG